MARKVLGSWMSANQYVPKCSHSCKTTDDVMRCVTDSHWYFIGDSTVRQIKSHLHCLASPQCPKVPDFQPHMPSQYFPKCRCTFAFHFFGLPISTSGSIRTFTSAYVPYAPEIIDSIVPSNSVGGDVVVIGSIHHFLVMPFPGFVKRMLAIRDALIRLRSRAPKMKIVWKGSNSRDVTSDFFMNNAKAEFYESVAQEIIRDVPSIYILDTWNILLGSPFGGAGEHKIHYPGSAISEIFRIIAGLVCSKRNLQ